MKVLNCNDWVYVVELREPTPTQAGQYFAGTKIRGFVCDSYEEAVDHLVLPDVSKKDVPIPDDIRSMIEQTLACEESVKRGAAAKTQLHEHISDRHTKRRGFWPLLPAAIRKLLGEHGAIEQDENTASVEEIYNRYL